MKTPFETIKEAFFDNLVKSKENSRFIFDHSDKLMTWIIGFATTGLTLIISKMSDFHTTFSADIVKWILNLLTICITTGILYRVFFYLAHIQLRHIEVYLENALANREYMRIVPTDVSDVADFREIIRRLQVDFGEDQSALLNIYDASTTEVQKELLESMKKHYASTNEWAENNHNYAINFIKDTYKKALGLSDKKISKMFVENSSYSTKYKIYSWVSIICFGTSITAFIITVFVLTTNY